MKAALVAENLTKEFNTKRVVDHVSFEAGEGQVFGLLGPNGAGKTTTIRLISTILTPTSGTASIGGFDIVKNPAEVRAHIAVLTTETGVYERFTGRENLVYFGNLYGLFGEALNKRISELSKLLDMEWFLDQRAGSYSTGMKQKLAVARSVIHDPKILIFDEPTTGLDVLASQTVLNFMKVSKDQGKCVLLSTHQMNDAEKLCDKVAIMHQGKIVVIDTVGAIKTQTKTSSLEDAFLKIVKEKNLEIPKEKFVEKKNDRFSLLNLITKK